MPMSCRNAVVLGAFLHDIGKRGEGPHVPVGTRVATAVLHRMGIEGDTAERARFLVQEHLLLADTAVRRDLSDPSVVDEVASRVGDRERLAMLHVVTAADARATGPLAWTPWRQALVRDLVARVDRLLLRRPDPAGEMLAARKAGLRERLGPAAETLSLIHI